MKSITVEQIDANSDSAQIRAWLVPDGDEVAAGAEVCTVETSKALFEVEAPEQGTLIHVYPAGATVPLNVAIGFVATSDEVADARRLAARASDRGDEDGPRATKKARQLAGLYGVDLGTLRKAGLITEQDVRAAISTGGAESATDPGIILESGILPDGAPRVLVIGAGLGAMQVIDILLNDPLLKIAGCIDDDPDTHGRRIFGVPVLGPTSTIEELWAEKKIDSAVISISTSISARKKLFEMCESLAIPLQNAIDPTVRINRGVVLGNGNVICSHVHLGVATVLGDNNFISANTSIDHHNIWGSHNTTGPNCATSSRVLVQDEVVFGTGVFIEPGIGIGSRAQIASGSIITRTIPEAHAVKSRTTYEIIPIPGHQKSGSK